MMRVVFMGTPAYGVPSLKKLIENGYEVVGVFTQPDKPVGRGNKVQMSAVKECALRHQIPVFQPKKMRVDGLPDLRALSPDLCVTAAFGQILSQENLDVPRLGTVNVHASLLPKYRGSSPINWCLINGEKVTGVTTMMTDRGMDTGDILLQRETPITCEDTIESLTTRLSEIGAELLMETLKRLEHGDCPRIRQDESQASYYPLLKKEMGEIDWAMPAEMLVNRVRGLTPWPSVYTYMNGEMLKIHRAQALDGTGAPGDILTANAKDGLTVGTGKGILKILELQAQGGKRMSANDYLRGHTLPVKRFDEGEKNHAE